MGSKRILLNSGMRVELRNNLNGSQIECTIKTRQYRKILSCEKIIKKNIISENWNDFSEMSDYNNYN